MRAVVQRVARAEVRVDAEVVGRIGPGLLVLVGAGNGDGAADVGYLVEKVVNLRIFADAEVGGPVGLRPSPVGAKEAKRSPQKMNRSLLEVGGGLLVVSQFTLHGDARKGRRPSFVAALEPRAAEGLYRDFIAAAARAGVAQVAAGRFGAMMDVELVNSGPVTILLDSRKEF